MLVRKAACALVPEDLARRRAGAHLVLLNDNVPVLDYCLNSSGPGGGFEARNAEAFRGGAKAAKTFNPPGIAAVTAVALEAQR